MLFAEEGFTYRNFLMDALAIFIFVVWFLVAHFGSSRPVPTPRYFGVGQGNLGDGIDNISVH